MSETKRIGRPSRSESQKKRIYLWYYCVLEGFGLEINTPAWTIGEVVAEMGEVKGIENLPSASAWRWWAQEARTPDRATAKRIDNLLEAYGKCPVRWMLTAPGKMTLEPVWAWPPNQSGLSKKSILKCAKVESQLWRRIDHWSVPDVCAEAGVLHIEEAWNLDDNTGELKCIHDWPPLLLLPNSIIKWATHREIGFPFPILSSKPYNVREFAKWSRKNENYPSGGNIWAYKMRGLNIMGFSPPLYEEDLEDLKWDELQQLIKDIA